MDLTVGIAGLGGVVVARVAGDLDLAAEDEFRTWVRFLRLGAAPRVILDLTGVTFLDARGLAALVEVAQQVSYHGGRLALVAAPTTRRLLHLTELDRVITVVDTVGEAVSWSWTAAGSGESLHRKEGLRR